MAALGAGFVVLSGVAAAGLTHSLDRTIDAWGQHLWSPGVEPVLRLIALLGGVEVTTALALGLFVWLRRRGFKSESWALSVYPLSVGLEVAYKQLVHQVGPSPGHADGPSLSLFFVHLVPYSFPSGHQVRTVVVYGLIAFCVHRLAPPGRLRRAVYPALAVMIGVMAVDRVVVEAHWASDVIGGLLLGGAALAAAVAWMDVPREVT
ncbi:MAG TPA: phosphatase PAP2 family protein [Candidatus Nitrosotalea sp.]|nr:phosphatase PAP2 family protein [Candidatus Nitrosotalea sp.]